MTGCGGGLAGPIFAGWDFDGAIVDEIKAMHDVGRPVLVGTTSVDKSELVSQMLTKRHGIKHEVLNAKQHEREADIVLEAGKIGAVMIATNRAGRGTDIKLQPISREQLIEHWQIRGSLNHYYRQKDTHEKFSKTINNFSYCINTHHCIWPIDPTMVF